MITDLLCKDFNPFLSVYSVKSVFYKKTRDAEYHQGLPTILRGAE